MCTCNPLTRAEGQREGPGAQKRLIPKGGPLHLHFPAFGGLLPDIFKTLRRWTNSSGAGTHWRDTKYKIWIFFT